MVLVAQIQQLTQRWCVEAAPQVDTPDTFAGDEGNDLVNHLAEHGEEIVAHSKNAPAAEAQHIFVPQVRQNALDAFEVLLRSYTLCRQDTWHALPMGREKRSGLDGFDAGFPGCSFRPAAVRAPADQWIVAFIN